MENNISISQFRNHTASRIFGTDGDGVAGELTGTQVTAILDVFTETLKGLVPAPTESSGKYLKDDGTWDTPDSSGITNGAAENEMMKSDGTNAVASGIFSTTAGSLIFGTGLSGTTRGVSAAGSGSNIDFTIDSKGTGNIRLDSNSGNVVVDRGTLYIGHSSLSVANATILAAGSGTNVGVFIAAQGNASVTLDGGASGGVNLGNGRAGALLIDHATGSVTWAFDFTMGTMVGDAGHPSGRDFPFVAGSAYADSGNGNGGSISFTTGERRAAGSGVDGNFSVDALTGDINFSATNINFAHPDDSRVLTIDHIGAVIQVAASNGGLLFGASTVINIIATEAAQLTAVTGGLTLSGAGSVGIQSTGSEIGIRSQTDELEVRAATNLRLTSDTGNIIAAGLRSTAGATGTFWYDPADGNRVKYVSS